MSNFPAEIMKSHFADAAEALAVSYGILPAESDSRSDKLRKCRAEDGFHSMVKKAYKRGKQMAEDAPRIELMDSVWDDTAGGVEFNVHRTTFLGWKKNGCLPKSAREHFDEYFRDELDQIIVQSASAEVCELWQIREAMFQIEKQFVKRLDNPKRFDGPNQLRLECMECMLRIWARPELIEALRRSDMRSFQEAMPDIVEGVQSLPFSDDEWAPDSKYELLHLCEIWNDSFQLWVFAFLRMN